MGHSPKLMIALCLTSFSWTYLFRNWAATFSIMAAVYFIWFLAIDSDHTLGAGAVLDMFSIILSIVLALFSADVLDIVPFVPPVNHAYAQNIDSWTIMMKFQRVAVACACTTALAFGWLFWNWDWAFMIIALLYVVVIGVSFFAGHVSDKHRNVAYAVWLVLTLWQVLFFGAAQQIDPAQGEFVWIIVVTVAPLALLGVVSALHVYAPSVKLQGKYFVLAEEHVSQSGASVLLPPTYLAPSGNGEYEYARPYGFASHEMDQMLPHVDDFSGSSMIVGGTKS